MRLTSFSNISNPALDKLVNGGSNAPAKKAGKEDGDFAKTLMDVLKEVNSSQQNSATQQNAFMAGQQVDYHDLMIAVEKASISLQLTMAVRNKILEAYSDISHMQI